MNLTNQKEARGKQIKALLNDYPEGQPVVMLNLIKVKEKIEETGESGMSSYKKYGKAVAPLLKKAEGKVLYSGIVKNTVIGDEEGQPHLVLLVQYPSTKHFVTMASSPEYAEIAHLRVNALEYGGLLACQTTQSLLGA